MKLLSGIITLLLAIIISAVAAYFSIVGLAALFAAAFIPVVIMAGSLEAGKLAAAQWLKSNWDNERVSWWHKMYLLLAIIALMIITALGIYGFLSKGHLEQTAPVAGITLQIAQKEQQIAVLNGQNDRLQEKIGQIDSGFEALMEGKNTTRAINERNKQKKYRESIEAQVDENYTKIQAIESEILPLRLQTTEVEAKLGPVKYVADLLGVSDPEAAVRAIILILMFAFDPLAIVLLLSSTITFTEYFEARRKRKEEKEKPISVPAEEPKAEVVVDVEPVIEEVIEPLPVIVEPVEKTSDTEFINQVIASGNVPPEIMPEIQSIPSKARKPRTPKTPKETHQDSVSSGEQLQDVTDENHIPVIMDKDDTKDTQVKSRARDNSWLSKPPTK